MASEVFFFKAHIFCHQFLVEHGAYRASLLCNQQADALAQTVFKNPVKR